MATAEIPVSRAQEEIFADLRDLAQSDGALHEISAIVYRDWVVTYDKIDGHITDSPEQRWSTDKLNKNEILLLLGLLVQSPHDRPFSIANSTSDFASHADVLLRELHDQVLAEIPPIYDPRTGAPVETSDLIGPVAREAIYYGPESFYQHQFSHFARLRYREDSPWLLRNTSLSIRPIVDIAKFIADRVNAQMSAVGAMRRDGHTFTNSDLTNSLLIPKEDLKNRFGEKANVFISKFSTPATNKNLDFLNPFSINTVSISPIIDIGEFLYVPNQYRLFESVYESPFFWMVSDHNYRSTHSRHRGDFLEKTTTHILRTVFGPQNVYENVTIDDGSKDRPGEIDALVVYGEFVLIVQAKSKRVTLRARAGDIDALRKDFAGAIQDPYRQAVRCATLIRTGAKCVTREGNPLDLPSLPRMFPVVILSDAFPASTLLSRMMLERGDGIAPVIWDLGILDCIARMLPSPVELLFYLQSRAQAFDTVASDSEYNFLGYHIKAKLALLADADFMMVERDFATVVDDYMLASDFGIAVDRPKGILERLSIPVVSDLLSELRNADPQLASVVVDLYDFSSAALEDLSTTILRVRQEVQATGKAIKAFSLPTRTGGITYAITANFSDTSRGAAELIGRKHKYDTRSDRWYVIVDSIETNNPIDGLLPLVYPWAEDSAEAANSAEVASYFHSRREEMEVGANRVPSRER